MSTDHFPKTVGNGSEALSLLSSSRAPFLLLFPKIAIFQGHACAWLFFLCDDRKNERESSFMKHLLVLNEYTYAGYCSTGGNKDWAACLAVEAEDQVTSPPTIDETTEVVYLSIHGPHGGNLIPDDPKKLSMKQAQAHFTNKCREKDRKAYAHVPFSPYLPVFGSPFGLTLIAEGEGRQSEGSETPTTHVQGGEIVPPLHYQAVALKAAPLAKIQQLLAEGSHCLSQKVNGERCLLVFERGRLAAYNRRGKLMSAPPAGAMHLCQLGIPFVIDGERLTRDLAGHFVAFDLLELDHNVLTSFSYIVRIKMLEQAMLQAGLLVSSRATPTWAEARANSTVHDLCLLVSAAGQDVAPQIIADIQASSGEGIVVRRLEASYAESPLKWKFVADIDAFVIGVNGGVAEGSLKFGMIRPEDGAIIEVGNVRSGFNDDAIRTVRQMLELGERPVFTITYLPVNTIGIQLVEPRSGMTFLRTDKEARQCTTEQFGAEKASDIARAKPVEGMRLL
jgi:hypothetical protein